MTAPVANPRYFNHSFSPFKFNSKIKKLGKNKGAEKSLRMYLKPQSVLHR